MIDHESISRAIEGIANPREHLVGEGKKFKTDEDLARGKLYSDLYVPQLENANTSLTTKLAQVEAELEELRSRAMETVNMVNEATTNSSNETNTATHNDPDAIARSVKEVLATERDAERRRTNVDIVIRTLQKNLGENYEAHMQKLAGEYGKEYLEKLAEDNPKVFLAIAKVEEPVALIESKRVSSVFSPPVNSINVQAKAGASNEKGHRHYQELRRMDPKRFNSPEIYRERLEAITKLGDRYFEI